MSLRGGNGLWRDGASFLGGGATGGLPAVRIGFVGRGGLLAVAFVRSSAAAGNDLAFVICLGAFLVRAPEPECAASAGTHEQFFQGRRRRGAHLLPLLDAASVCRYRFLALPGRHFQRLRVVGGRGACLAELDSPAPRGRSGAIVPARRDWLVRRLDWAGARGGTIRNHSRGLLVPAWRLEGFVGADPGASAVG